MTALESSTQIWGRVVGLSETSLGVLAKISLECGATEEFLAVSEDVALSALALFRQTVRATVVYTIDGDHRKPQYLEEVIAWKDCPDVLTFFDKVRGDLRASGVHLRASDLLSDVDDSDEV